MLLLNKKKKTMLKENEKKKCTNYKDIYIYIYIIKKFQEIDWAKMAKYHYLAKYV